MKEIYLRKLYLVKIWWLGRDTQVRGERRTIGRAHIKALGRKQKEYQCGWNFQNE